MIKGVKMHVMFQRLHSPMGKETLGVSVVTHGHRNPSKARASGSRMGISITAGIMESGLVYTEVHILCCPSLHLRHMHTRYRPVL